MGTVYFVNLDSDPETDKKVPLGLSLLLWDYSRKRWAVQQDWIGLGGFQFDGKSIMSF